MENKEILQSVIDATMIWHPIAIETVRAWMQCQDIEVMGAVADFITYSPNCEKIDPPLSEQELEDFLFPYYERCMKEDPHGEWAGSRYGVTDDIKSWFNAVPPEEDIYEQSFLKHLKEWMARIYHNNGTEIRDAIVCGALEHILEEPRWREFFGDWRDDTVLHEAYDQAMEWAVEHER